MGVSSRCKGLDVYNMVEEEYSPGRSVGLGILYDLSGAMKISSFSLVKTSGSVETKRDKWELVPCYI